MGKKLPLLCLFSVFIGLGVVSDADQWNILVDPKIKQGRNWIDISLKNYCESWRMNVELNNIQGFDVVPEECTDYIGKYMKSTQYKVDSQRAIQESMVYLRNSCNLKKDGGDAWIFDVDDTLISTLPYYKNHNYGGEKLNLSSLEVWMRQGKAPALEHSLSLFNEIKARGVDIILVSSRREHLRSSTIDNLVNVGFYGWTHLILRGQDEEYKQVQKYKADVRKQLTENGYQIWGIVGDQWSSFDGFPTGKRTFKLPNPLYYVS